MARGVARTAVSILACFGLVSGAEAGLLDVLFSPHSAVAPQDPPVVRLAPIAPQVHPAFPSAEPRPPRRRRAAHRRRSPARPPAADAAQEDRVTPQDLHKVLEQDGAEAAFLQDPTLRPGDVVVLTHGLRVFKGRRSAHHAASDFVQIEHARVAHRRELMAMDRGNTFWATGSRNVVVLAESKHRPLVLTIRRGTSAVETLSRNNSVPVSLRRSD